MIHPECGGKATVIETRELADRVRRRYSCHACNVRFTSYEMADDCMGVEQIQTAIKLLRSALTERKNT